MEAGTGEELDLGRDRGIYELIRRSLKKGEMTLSGVFRLGFCVWDIPAAYALAGVIVFGVIQRRKYKKRHKALQDASEKLKEAS